MARIDFGDALNLALREEMRRDPRVYCIGEDIVLGLPFGVTKGLVDEFGADRVLNAPISEAAIVGSSFGAAVTGLWAFVVTAVAYRAKRLALYFAIGSAVAGAVARG